MAPPPIPPSLSPLEAALVQALQTMHADVVASAAQLSGELRAFRLQFLGALMAVVLFLIAILASSKGIDPRIPAVAVQGMLSPAPATLVSQPAVEVVEPPAAAVVLPDDGPAAEP